MGDLKRIISGALEITSFKAFRGPWTKRKIAAAHQVGRKRNARREWEWQREREREVDDPDDNDPDFGNRKTPLDREREPICSRF